MDRINVIIANKDYSHYLPDAILSCKTQTIPVTYTVIDDNSNIKPKIPDGFIKTEENESLEEWKDASDNRYIFLKQTTGPSTARNIGIIKVIHDYTHFMILDADDMMLPNKCEHLLKTIKEDPNIGVVYGDYYILDEDGLLKMEFKKPYSRARLERECVVHSGSLISKDGLVSAFDPEFGFYDPKMRVAEDYDLWMRISEKMSIKHIPEFLSVVRNHRRNSSTTVNTEVWNQCLTYLHQKRLQRAGAI